MRFFKLENGDECPSYVIVDQFSHCASVVNPRPSLERFIALSHEHAFRIRYVFIANCDQPFNMAQFAKEIGANVYTFREQPGSPTMFSLVKSGDVFEYGDVRLKFFAASAEASCPSLLVFDLTVSDRAPCIELGSAEQTVT